MSRRARAPRTTLGMRIRASAPPAVAVLLVIVAIFLPDPRDKPREPDSVAVSRTAYACPADAAMAAGQVAPAQSVRAISLPSRRRLASLERTNVWRQASPTRPVVIEQFGRGSGATGFFAATAPEDDGAGLIVGECPPTVDESWFVGLGSGAKHESRLVFTNLSDVIAVADVSLWGDEGPIDAVGGTGIVIQPYRSRTITVSSLAAGEREVAAQVERSRGAFSVVAFDGSRQVDAGSEAAPPTLSPRRDQVVAGVPAGAKNRTLLVLNPSTTTSRLSVSVLGRRGPFAPDGLDAVRLPAGAVTTVSLPSSLGNDAFSLSLHSDQPVVAAIRAAAGKQDYGYAVSTPRLDGPALVPVDLNAGTERPRLSITAADDEAAAVSVTGFDARMRKLGSSRTDIATGSTVGIDLTKLTDSDALAYVVVEPTAGRVVGSAAFRKDDGLAIVPLREAPIRVLGPDVRYVP